VYVERHGRLAPHERAHALLERAIARRVGHLGLVPVGSRVSPRRRGGESEPAQLERQLRTQRAHLEDHAGDVVVHAGDQLEHRGVRLR
jgi:hypothetical protein